MSVLELERWDISVIVPEFGDVPIEFKTVRLIIMLRSKPKVPGHPD